MIYLANFSININAYFNRFVILYNIRIAIRILYHSFETLLLLSLFLFNGKIRPSPAHLILPIASSPRPPSRLFETQG